MGLKDEPEIQHLEENEKKLELQSVVNRRPKIGIAIRTKEVKAWRTLLEVGVLTWLKGTGARGDRQSEIEETDTKEQSEMEVANPFIRHSRSFY